MPPARSRRNQTKTPIDFSQASKPLDASRRSRRAARNDDDVRLNQLETPPTGGGEDSELNDYTDARLGSSAPRRRKVTTRPGKPAAAEKRPKRRRSQ